MVETWSSVEPLCLRAFRLLVWLELGVGCINRVIVKVQRTIAFSIKWWGEGENVNTNIQVGCKKASDLTFVLER